MNDRKLIETGNLRRKHHYVPQVYLKHFSAPDEKIWIYRTLVSHPRVPQWKNGATGSIAYLHHLYTQVIAGQETDEFEKWLDQDFESPGAEALDKATSDVRLSPNDWTNLIRFIAAQDVRTPARLIDSLQRWHETMPDFLQATTNNAIKDFEKRDNQKPVAVQKEVLEVDKLPLRVKTEKIPGKSGGMLKAEIVVGRKLWLWSVQHTLTKTFKVLLQHRWTILRPAKNYKWFTSDNPVIRLNYYGNGKYDFKGGWGKVGGEIIVPLSPQHLLYTKIGKQPPFRGETMPLNQTKMIRSFIAEHAFRKIFAASIDNEIPELRPREVDAGLLQSETEQWRKWHADQLAAEHDLINNDL